MPTVHLVHGLPGSGKSARARELAARHGAEVLNHDVRMIARHGSNPPEADFARLAAAVSAELWTETERCVAAGRDVVLDWGFWTRGEREEARQRIRAMGARCMLHRMVCADAVARRRTVERSARGGAGVLEINGEAWDSFRARFEPLGADEEHADLAGE